MKTILKAAALVLAMTTAAHASSSRWIVVTTHTDEMDQKVVPAMIGGALYPNKSQCFYAKGRLEVALQEGEPDRSYSVFCAYVPE